MKIRSLEWMRKVLQIYNSKKGVYLKDSLEDVTTISFEPKQFKLALLHLFKLQILERIQKEIPNRISNPQSISNLHQFYYFVDLLRRNFADWFSELISRRDFSPEEYYWLALEFLTLDEQLKKQIQIPLLKRIKDLISLAGSSFEENRDLNQNQWQVFFRLVRFFKSVEAFEESKTRDLLEEAERVLSMVNLELILKPKEVMNLKAFEEKFLMELKQLLKN
ncbi:MAG: hypothetical protein N2327_06970 [Caldimicrobium sp.]|nr:hypothetical protein [Caldimicrobium sp.]MDW8093712.1 hypothetical protein [Caldimicrobium sp.]